jgi:hypothetical protein
MMPAIVQPRPELSAETPPQPNHTWAHVEQNATRALDAHPHFRGRTKTVRIECRHDTLTITGRLPSFYLKQLLQETLRRVDGVDRIDNRVDVICCGAASSTAEQ